MVNFIVFLWASEFISSMTDMILIGAFTTWYWSYKKSKVPFFTLASSAAQVFRYHIGTVALGSLVNYICRLLRAIFGIRMTTNGFGPCACLGIHCSCTLREFLRRFHGNAYIMCTMHGNGYCASALDAYQLICRNSSQYISTAFVCRLVFFFGKVMLACVTGAVVYLYYGIHVVVPLFGLTFGAFFIFRLFFSVYSTAVDTLVLCSRKYFYCYYCHS